MRGVDPLSTVTAHVPRPHLPRSLTNWVPPWVLLFWVIVLSAFLLLSGCTWPSLFKRTPAAPQPSLTIQAQTRLLNDAQEQLDRGRARKAIQLLRNLIDSHPHSPFLPEMRWTLARAYEKSGDLESAVGEYRGIIGTDKTSRSGKGRYAEEARRRLIALEPNVEPTRRKARAVTAILIQPNHLPPRAELAQWLKHLADTGVTALILEAASKPTQGQSLLQTSLPNGQDQTSSPAGVYFRTQWALVIEDYIDQLVPIAHEQGLSVFGAMTLRRMSWLEPPVGWADWTYNPAQQEVQRSIALDLFHPGFQEYLMGLLGDLADTGIDGLLVRAGAPMGPTDGFSPFALDGFRQAFGSELRPSTLFIPGQEPASIPTATKDGSETQAEPRYTPEFWRWAGWKAREQLRIMSQLKAAMRRRSPNLTFAVELHSEAVHDPVHALAHYTEDLLEAKRIGFDYILTEYNDTRVVSWPNGSPRHPVADPTNQESKSSLLEHAIDRLGDARRVWIARSLPPGDLSTLSRHLNPQADRVNLPEQVGLVYVESLSSVP